MRAVVEFILFTRLVDSIATHPESGDLISGAGGARTLRWGSSGRGKSGGARIITYQHCQKCPIYLIMIYLKKERADLSQTEVAWLYSAAKDLNNAHQDHC